MRLQARSCLSKLLNFIYCPIAPKQTDRQTHTHTHKHSKDPALSREAVSDRSHALKERSVLDFHGLVEPLPAMLVGMSTTCRQVCTKAVLSIST